MNEYRHMFWKSWKLSHSCSKEPSLPIVHISACHTLTDRAQLLRAQIRAHRRRVTESFSKASLWHTSLILNTASSPLECCFGVLRRNQDVILNWLKGKSLDLSFLSLHIFLSVAPSFYCVAPFSPRPLWSLHALVPLWTVLWRICFGQRHILAFLYGVPKNRESVLCMMSMMKLYGNMWNSW